MPRGIFVFRDKSGQGSRPGPDNAAAQRAAASDGPDPDPGPDPGPKYKYTPWQSTPFSPLPMLYLQHNMLSIAQKRLYAGGKGSIMLAVENHYIALALRNGFCR